VGFVVLDLLFSVQCFVLFSFGHCVVCPSIYSCLLSLWYNQIFLIMCFFFLAGRSLNDYNYFPFYVKVFIVVSTNIAKRGLTDTKGVIRIRISKKNRQHNDQRKTYKRTNNDLQITEDRVTRTTLKTGGELYYHYPWVIRR
jgi:hypothetical protein